MKVDFLSLQSENETIKSSAIKKIARFVDESNFILGKDVELFEKNFAKFCKAKFAVGVNSGTDALHIALRACGIRAGDEVITTPMSYTATSLAVTYCNAAPVFVDVLEDGNIDPSKIESAITRRTKAILITHLYGHVCDMAKIKAIAKKYKLFLIDDCAHAHGATYRTKRIGSLTDISCWSFYPTKNLGAWGDAGALTTNSRTVYVMSKLLRNYGEAKKNDSRFIGFNSRLQSIQAIVLNEKLPHLPTWNTKRVQVARIYTEKLAGVGDIRTLPFSGESSYYMFPIKTKYRSALQKFLFRKGIQTLIHYPTALHLQKCFAYLGYKKGAFPVAERHASEVLSLPFHHSLSARDQHYVIATIKEFFAQKK